MGGGGGGGGDDEEEEARQAYGSNMHTQASHCIHKTIMFGSSEINNE